MPLALQENTQDSKLAQESRVIWGRQKGKVAILAVLIFAGINATLWWGLGKEKEASKDLWNGTGSIDLAINHYVRLKTKPTVVLLGSSLMMYPFWAMDKERNPKIADIFHHHISQVLESELAARNIKNAKVYSLAIFGQMVSDAYLYVDNYLKGQKAPKCLVYGIAPRDFSDFDLPAPMATLSFKRLVTLANFGCYAPLYLPHFHDKMDFFVSRIIFLYNKRWRLQNEVERALGKVYTWLGLINSNDNTASQNQAGFMLAGRQDVRWANSAQEYKRRYRRIEERSLGLQMEFLQKLLWLCKKRHIKVILVNMPLSDVNRNLLPGGFYEQFSKQVSNIARSESAEYLDLGKSANFSHGDFWDTTHLNHAGGHKLLHYLIPHLTSLQQGERAQLTSKNLN